MRARTVIHRFGLHACIIPVWVLVFLVIAPLGWLTVNEFAWQSGIGSSLTERPLAAVHHRIMGAIQEWDNTGEAIAYYKGHLRDYTDATTETRTEWQYGLDQARQTQLLLLIKAAIIAVVAYIPFGFILARWYHNEQLADAASASGFAS